MKKAVITTGGHQYLVSEGDVIEVERLLGDKKLTFEPLLVIEDSSTKVGKPTVAGAKVNAEVVEEIKAEKVIAIRYKAKKRVHKTRGHRQKLTRIKISKIV